jgi:CHAT domain-containing protein/Tfp pilus assembly protein PilF
MRLFLAVIVASSGAWSGVSNTCLPLSLGQTLLARTSIGQTACFLVTVESGEATQLSIEQPADFALRVVGGAEPTIADGFEFGGETLTILTAGHYRVEVQPVDTRSTSAWTFSMSRRSIPLQSAQTWRDAETSATTSKRSGKLQDIEESLSHWMEVGDASGIARTYLEQGDASLGRDDPSAARTAYEQALRMCVSLSDLRCVAEAANNSGYAASVLGDLEASSSRLREAASYWRRISLRPLEGRTLSNLGLMYWESGDFERAIQVLDEARRILRGRDTTGYARTLNNLGLYYQSLSENEKALAYFQSALTIFLGQHQRAVRVHLNLGRSYMLLGKLERSNAALEQALTEATDAHDLSGRADVLNNLGQVLLKLHRWDLARSRLTEALALQRLVRSKRGEAIALHYLGIEAGQRGDTESARQSLTAASRIRRESGLLDDASESVFALAELEYNTGNLIAARELAGQAIELIESLRSKVPSRALRATYYSRKRRFFDLLTDIAMIPANRGNGAEGLLASEQAHGRSLLDLLTNEGIGSPIPPELLERRVTLRRKIAVLSLRLTDADPPQVSEPAMRDLDRRRDDLKRQIELFLAEDDQVESLIRQASSTVGRPLTSVAEIQTALPTGSAVLEYYLGERQSYVWVIQATSLQSFRLPPRSAIEAVASRTLTRFGAILDRRRSPLAQAAFDTDLSRLSAVLLGPLADSQLPPRLVLVLDGILNRVPMEALRPPGAREPLGLSSDLIRAASAAHLLAAKPPRPVSAFLRSVLAVADPVFGPDDPRLTVTPGTSGQAPSLPRLPFNAELAELKSLVPPARIRILQGFDASASELHNINLEDFAVLHFSTHAFIDNQIPELSRVTLSLIDRRGRPVDGYLRPRHFREFRLNRSIVVLSSCETALGKEVMGEGLAGFSDSLFSAGASQLVLSLTQVDAEASAVFFRETYRRFFGPQQAAMESALTHARRVLAHSRRWSDPYYWASFTVIGSLSGAR